MPLIETHRFTRTQFERWLANRDVSLVVMEACGSAHHLARWLTGLGIEVKLLPAQHVRAYVRRNKTDAADAAPCGWALVPRAICALRGCCRGFGIAIPTGARTGIEVISRVLADPATAVPELIRGMAALLIDEIRLLEARIAQMPRQLAQAKRVSPACVRTPAPRRYGRAIPRWRSRPGS